MENLRDLHAHITGSIDARSVFDIIVSEGLHISDSEKIDSLTEPLGMKLADELSKDATAAEKRFETLYPYYPNGKVDFKGIMRRFVFTAYLINKVPDAERKIGYEVANRFKQQGVNYVEWRVDPFSATDNQTAEEGIKKLHGFFDGMREVNGLNSKLVLSIAKSRYGHNWKPLPEKIEYLHSQMEKLLDAETGLPIVGLDAVNKDEIRLKELKSTLELSNKHGLILVPHVGELAAKNLETDMGNMEYAVRIGSKRLGHAIAAYMPLDRIIGSRDNTGRIYDSKRIDRLKLRQGRLLDKLEREDVAIEVCPTSNLAAHLGFTDYVKHPVDILSDRKIPFVVCTDDYGIFGSPLSRELELMREKKGVDMDNMLYNSRKYSIEYITR